LRERTDIPKRDWSLSNSTSAALSRQHHFHTGKRSTICTTSNKQPYTTSEQPSEQSPAAPEQQIQHAATPERPKEDTPWSPPVSRDTQKHKMCSNMVEAFSRDDTEKASMLACLLLLQPASTCRVYVHLVSP
jgi:hypothetical protein